MKNTLKLLILSLSFVFSQCQNQPTQKAETIALNPENPNYFIYKGKPTILVTSGEHYGAVMNTAFDYMKYLQTLKNDGLNYTRIFTGPYSEMGDKTFGIRNNTMNPSPENYLTPWAKDASGKYNLDVWNQAYFERLKSFVGEAEKLGIVVEITLYTSYYSNHQWSKSPFNPVNNIQKTDSLAYKQLNTVNCGGMMKYHENYVRKMVQELNAYGNIHFEIQNEPWSDNPHLVEKITETDTITHPFAWQKIVEIANTESLEWQKQIAQIIRDEENKLPNKHLIAQNISNFRYKIDQPDPNVSIFNFHYAYPEAASANVGLNKALGLDETGFMPKNDFHYRSQAWKFMLAGGALYNNLDYSFTVGHEDGSYPIDEGTPGWGHTQFRKQLKIMKEFIESYDFIRMKPDNAVLSASDALPGTFQVLSETGKQYAIYMEKPQSPVIKLQIPDGVYQVKLLNPISGEETSVEELSSKNGSLELNCSITSEDAVIKIVAKNK
jgi:hypothetical protein